MKIYNYNNKTGEYQNSTQAHKNPLNKDKFLIPACATTTSPPQIQDGKVRVFNNNKWQQITDKRGTVAYTADRQEIKVDYLGELKPEHFKTQPAKSAELIKTEAIDKLKSDRNRELDNLTITHEGNEYQADDKSLIRMQTKINAKASSDKISWILKDNSIIEITEADLNKIYKKADTAISKIKLKYNELIKNGK